MLLEDTNQAMKLSTAEGWNQTEKDWELMIKTPVNICLAAKIKNKVVGTSIAINYNNDVAWIGMVLVDKNHRGRGVSKLLLSNLFNRLGHCKSVKLDATPAGQPVYQKFGFKDEYVIHRMVGRPILYDSSQSNISNTELLQTNEVTKIIELDNQVFGANRKPLIEFLSRQFPDKSWVLKQDDKIMGFALGRGGSRFYQIGPVSAIHSDDAKALIQKAIEGIGNQEIVIDVVDDKTDLIDWLISIGFKKRRYFMRMYQNENPFPGIIDHQFLICGPEFG